MLTNRHYDARISATKVQLYRFIYRVISCNSYILRIALLCGQCYRKLAVTGLALLLVSCTDNTLNSPYPAADIKANTLYSSFSERPKHLDPARSYSSNEYSFIAQIYEPPFQYHYLKRPYELVPLTAESMPELAYLDSAGELLPADASPGEIAETIYEISIKPGIMYQPHPAFVRDQSGALRYADLTEAEVEAINTLSDFSHNATRELTADDYIYEIKRLAQARTHSPIASLMQEYIIGFREFGELVDTQAEKAKKASNGRTAFVDLNRYDMAGLKRVDRYTYRIRIKGTYPQFKYWLAMPFFAPMPWEADKFYSQKLLAEKNISLNWYPVGTGPYMLTENNPNLRMVLSRNPNFHGEEYPRTGEPGDRANGLLIDAGESLPFIDKAVYNLEKETIPYWNKFLQGYYDSSGVSSDSFDQAIVFGAGGEAQLTDAMKQRGIRLAVAVQASIYYMGFNMNDRVVGGDSERARLLRRAISIAMDYEEFISIFTNDRGVAAHGIIPPGIFGAGEDSDNVNHYVYRLDADGSLRRRTIEEARALLRKAGYANGVDVSTGKPLILYYDARASGPGDKARMNWIVKQFEKLGIELVVRATDYNRFQEKMRKGSAQIFIWGWNADYPDPENFMFLLYGENTKQEHDGENAANYQNPEFDRLFDQMKHMPDSQQRLALLKEMTEIIRRDAPWVWGYHPKGFVLFHDWLHNIKPNLMANNTLKYRRLDPVLRAQQREAWNKPVFLPLVAIGLLLLVVIVPGIIAYRNSERRAAL